VPLEFFRWICTATQGCAGVATIFAVTLPALVDDSVRMGTSLSRTVTVFDMTPSTWTAKRNPVSTHRLIR